MPSSPEISTVTVPARRFNGGAHGSYIGRPVSDKSFQAYLARPAQMPAAAVVVVQESFGNADLRKTCDDLATQGYVALSPDLFWRLERGVINTPRSEADWNMGLSLYLPSTTTLASLTSWRRWTQNVI